MEAGRMTLIREIIGPMMNFIYIIGCPETGEAAVVDPAWDTPAILRLARDSGLAIGHILMTHAHPDHMNGLEQMLKDTNALVYLHRDEVGYMQECGNATGIPTAFMQDRSENFRIVRDGDTARVGRLTVECLHTPGHTPGSQCFLIEGSLFSGDTLFVDACGRVDMPGGDAVVEVGDELVLHGTAVFVADVSLPDVSVPEVAVPDVALPEVDSSGGGAR